MLQKRKKEEDQEKIMVKCRSQKCLVKQRKIIDSIMKKIPIEFQLDYERVRKQFHITRQEWKEWMKRHNKNETMS